MANTIASALRTSQVKALADVLHTFLDTDAAFCTGRKVDGSPATDPLDPSRHPADLARRNWALDLRDRLAADGFTDEVVVDLARMIGRFPYQLPMTKRETVNKTWLRMVNEAVGIIAGWADLPTRIDPDGLRMIDDDESDPTPDPAPEPEPSDDDSEFSDPDRPNNLELAMAAAWDPEELGTGSLEESITDTLDAHESTDASLSDPAPSSLDLDSVLPWTCEFLETLGSGPRVAQERPATPDAGSVDPAPESGSDAILSDPGTVPAGWDSIDAGHESIPEGWGEVDGGGSPNDRGILPVSGGAPEADIRVTGTDIIGTGIRVYSAWEPSKIGSGGHGTIRSFDGAPGWSGRIGTGPLPRDLDALPAYSDERIAAVSSWLLSEYDRAYAAIMEQHPEAGSGRRSMGQVEVTASDPAVKSSRQVAIDCGKSLQRLASKAPTETERRDLLRKARAFYLDAGLVGLAAWCERNIGS